MRQGQLWSSRDLFSKLRPICVQLSQAALRYKTNSENLDQIVDLTARLRDILQIPCIGSGDIISPKLADYIFFPLSQVFGICQSEHNRLAELATGCLIVLLRHGWQDAIAVVLGKQLIVLLTSFVQRVSGSAGPGELQDEAFKALDALFKAFRKDVGHVLAEDEFVPSLGVCLSAVLDGLSSDLPAKTQLLALDVLQSFWNCIDNGITSFSFLPGTISAITKCLHPTTRNVRMGRVLIRSLQVLEAIMVRCLGDIWVGRARNVPGICTDGSTAAENSAWLDSTMSHVKLALSSIVRLKIHKDSKVRLALQRFCLALLDHCHETMSGSRHVLVETSMVLMSGTETMSTEGLGRTLHDLASDHVDVAESIKLIVYAWLSGFPRLMLSLDETTRSTALANLSLGMVLLSTLKLDTWTISTAMLASVQEGLVFLMGQGPSNSKIRESKNFERVTTSMTTGGHTAQFAPLLLQHEAQKTTRELLDHLLDGFGDEVERLQAVQQILPQVANVADANKAAASLWLAQKLVKSISKGFGFGGGAEPRPTDTNLHVSVMDELLAHAVRIISERQSMVLLKALALETIAYSAQMMATDFRTMLIETLCPIIDCLSSSDLILHEHALTTLDIVASACNYPSTNALIVGNVDYLVNHISLQLNTFNIAPEYPQILVMIIKMTGPSLLPYLDDVVEAIFSALANFHGYPSLVDSLFSVLAVIVEQANLSADTTLDSFRHRKSKGISLTAVPVDSILQAMGVVKSDCLQTSGDEDDSEENPFQNIARPPLPGINRPAQSALGQPGSHASEPITTYATIQVGSRKTYKLTSHIVRLGQNFLTDSSPSLRRKILIVIRNSCASLCTNEDEFLPIVNDIWDPVLQRLHDDEAYVVIAAAETLTELCAYAGDFVSTRISSCWQDLSELFLGLKGRVCREYNSGNKRGIHNIHIQVWKAIRCLLETMMDDVFVSDDIFDSALELLSDDASQGTPHPYLSRINADAVWLQTPLGLETSRFQTPTVAGFTFKPVS